MQLLLAPAVGLLAGLHSASWGMYKDAPHEGFTWPKYLRSPVLAAVIAVLVHPVVGLDLATAPDLALFFGLVYVLERIVLEFYKTFLREEDQSKYTIPMQLHVGGTLVEGRGARWGAGAAYLLGLLVLFGGVLWLERTRPDLPGAVGLAIGSLGGWISAFGGAWKDAPIEGFEWPKFFRSPLVALAWAFPLAHLTHSYVLLALAATGYTVATIETYKTFFFPHDPRGKFQDEPVRFPDLLAHRQRVIPLYAGIWTLVLGVLAVALVGPREGFLTLL